MTKRERKIEAYIEAIGEAKEAYEQSLRSLEAELGCDLDEIDVDEEYVTAFHPSVLLAKVAKRKKRKKR